MYKIGELAKLTGLTTPTLRFYEQEQLLHSSARTDTGYRLYDDEALQQARFINHAKQIGFSLNDIRQFLDIRVDSEQYQCEQVKVIALDKLASVREQVRHLQQIEARLVKLSDACCGGPESANHCSILNALEQEQEPARGLEPQKGGL